MLSAGPDCGFLTVRGYRAFKTRPLSRMAARREALARDITSIHGDEFIVLLQCLFDRFGSVFP